jgi:(R,R)-butanediol dehydrogenase / meso-butanediol dehydrogenase / diacetyl reductase
MRAAVFHGAHDLRLTNVAEAREPAPDEIRLRVTRCGICGTDCDEYASGPHLVPVRTPHSGSHHVGPTIMGHEFVGEVEAVGESVAEFAIGDRVACGSAVSCGRCEWCRAGRPNICSAYYTLGLHADGGLAELATVPAYTCVPIPDGLPDDIAALAQPLCIALHAVDRSGARPGSSAVVIGAGGVGSLVIGALCAMGLQVIAVDLDPRKLGAAAALGAQPVNPDELDAVAFVLEETESRGAHVVVEASGAPPSPGLAAAVVRRGGRLVIIGIHREPVATDFLDMVMREIDVVASTAHSGREDVRRAIGLLADGNLGEQLPTRTIAFDDLIEGGLEPLAAGETTDKLIVDLTAVA